MFEIIKSDLFRYYGGYNFKLFLKGLINPGFRYILIFRFLKRISRISPLYYLFAIYIRWLSRVYGFQIPISTDIGLGFYIGHFGTIVINGNSKIGNNCNITHNVTIGRTNRGKLKGTPVIGNEVWIGTGSVIVGNIIIGNNVLIAPNSFVNFDVPDNSLVIGNPSKIIFNERATEGYINNIYIQDESFICD